jgi:predicted transposase/invertase (TIGR01784 family)
VVVNRPSPGKEPLMKEQSNTIDTMGVTEPPANAVKPKLDIIFKKLFVENTDRLHDFLAAALAIPHGAIKGITIKNPEILPDAAGGKLSRVDILLQMGDRVVNVEMQVSRKVGYRDRALYYWSKLYAGELKSGDDYWNLKQSVCINIVSFNLFRRREYHSHFAVMEKTRHEMLTDKCAMHFFELEKLGKEINPDDRLELWLQLINAETKEELDMLEKTGDAPIQKAVYTLYQMSEDEKLQEMARQREKALHDYVSDMNGARREGIEIGIEQGIEIGIERSAKALAEKDALIKELQAQLEKAQG